MVPTQSELQRHLMERTRLRDRFSRSVMPLYKYMDIPGIDFLRTDGGPRGLHQRGEVTLRHLFNVSSCPAGRKGRHTCEMAGVSAQGITFSRQKYIFDYFIALGINYRCGTRDVLFDERERKRFYAPHMSYQRSGGSTTEK